LGGASLAGGPIGLGVASGLLVASALGAAYLNNVSANRFAPKNQDYQSSRLLWGAPENVASRMAACAELRDIAGQFGKVKPGKRQVKVMDHVKCFGYWAGTVATIGTLPKFSSTVRDFKTKYDVSRSLIQDQDRQKLVARYCDTLIKSNQDEITSLEDDIKTMTEAINHLTDDGLSQQVKGLLLKQLVLKQLAHDKLQHEVGQAQYIKLSLMSMPGVAYSEFLKLTHMDVTFVETMDVLRKGHQISDAHRKETMLESSEPLKYLGQCSHRHKHKHKHHHQDHHGHGHHCDHHHHSHKKPFEITYDFSDACQNDNEKNRYLSAFDYVVNTNLQKEMDEQWVKRGNHLEAWLLLNRKGAPTE
jgi:hypothetical protein